MFVIPPKLLDDNPVNYIWRVGKTTASGRAGSMGLDLLGSGLDRVACLRRAELSGMIDCATEQ
jgi:hypothetical protein